MIAGFARRFATVMTGGARAGADATMIESICRQPCADFMAIIA